MKKLKEITDIVTRKKVVKLEVLDEYILNKPSKINEFFDGITSNRFKNDRDAANYLYNSNPQDPKYRKLKSRFRQKLLNTIFLIEPNKPLSSGYDRTYFNCHKEWAQIKILTANNALLIAESLTRQLLNISQKFKFTDITLNCLRELRAHAVRKEDQKSFDHYIELEKKYEALFQKENRSKELLERTMLMSMAISNKPEVLPSGLIEYCEEMVSLSELYDSPTIFKHMFKAWIIRYELEADHYAIVEVCIQAEQYLLNNEKYFPTKDIYSFYVKKMLAFLHLQDYSRGKKHSEDCLPKIPNSSYEWFKFMEIYLLLAIHAQNYYQAFAIFNNIISNNNFKKLEPVEKEKWKLFNAYMHYALKMKSLDKILLNQAKQSGFVLEEYMTLKPDFPKNLRNLEILKNILVTLYLIKQKKYNRANEKIDHLNYTANHKLEKKGFYRSIQFIKLLTILKKANYQIEEIRLADKYYSRLRNQPFYYRGKYNGLEIIPYETLWEMVLEDLTK
jgi:hypothetical protein